MTKLYLIRHGEYANPNNILPGRLPVELSEKGIEDIHKVKNYLSDKNISKIFSSAVLRCKQTSAIISDNSVPVEFDRRLLESFSAYQGYWVHDWSHFWAHRLELGGESNKEVQDRMVDFFLNTTFEDDKNYIICSHGDPLYYLYEHIAGLPLDPDYEPHNLVNTPVDYQSKGSIRIITGNNSKWEVGELIKPEDL